MQVGHKYTLDWKTFFFLLPGSMGWMRGSQLRVTRSRSSSSSSSFRTVTLRSCRSLTPAPTSCEEHPWEEQLLRWLRGWRGLCLCFIVSCIWNLGIVHCDFHTDGKTAGCCFSLWFAGHNTTTNPDPCSSSDIQPLIMGFIFSALSLSLWNWQSLKSEL